MRHTWFVTYPDGDTEYWHNSVAEVVPELKRLQKLYDDKIKIDRSLNPSKFLEQTNLKFPSWEKMLDDLGEEINKRKFDAKN